MAKSVNRVPQISATSARRHVFGPPPILEGEDAAVYEEFFARICRDIKPDILEEMLIEDIVYNEWELSRLRRLRARSIDDRDQVEKVLARALSPYVRRRKAKTTRCELAAETEDSELSGGTEGSESPLETADWEPFGETTDCESLTETVGQESPAETLARKWASGNPAAIQRVKKIMNSRKLTMEDVYARVLDVNLDKIERIDHLIANRE